MTNGSNQPKHVVIGEGLISLVALLMIVIGFIIWAVKAWAVDDIPNLSQLAVLVAAMPVGAAVGRYIVSRI